MAKLIKLTRELLDSQALGTLRALGRVVGIKSPTSKAKSVLIEEILLMQETGVCFTNSNKGAPVKSKVDLSDFYVKEELPMAHDRSLETFTYEETNDLYKNVGAFTFCDNEPVFETSGLIEVFPAGFAFIRTNGYECSDNDSHISLEIMEKFNLRAGDKVKALAKRCKDQKAPSVIDILELNSFPIDFIGKRKNFDDLTSCYPTKRFNIGKDDDLTLKTIDLIAPIGKGQRSIIVAPPKTGKTTIIKKLAQSLLKNHNGTKIFILLIDERPEEVTDLKRSVHAEVVHSTFDENSDHHVRAAEMVLSRAKRIAETGSDVIILLDSLTRLTRAYNDKTETSGKTLSGGIESEALKKVKKFFGSARNIEEGGSLTIIATAMVGLGGKFEDFVYEELKGTGNMELTLSRELSDMRIFPAIDINKSGTRREELLFNEEEQKAVNKLRRVLALRKDSSTVLLNVLDKCTSTEDFVKNVDTLLAPYRV